MQINLFAWFLDHLEDHGIHWALLVQVHCRIKNKGTATSNTSGGGISNVMSVDGGDAEFGFTYAHTVAKRL